ncbi:hypothetical protein SEA_REDWATTLEHOG_192 [Gordonia phage RedWattleHog]|uniref:Uncharacterized protein n=1 Tax=Gordonia phage Stormageddon TaxID=2656541 RepID=A0A649VU15_9CAUD|nr:hypothetical protein KHQ86_gp107 [Gordonia phage Stormageddon]QGJ95053.1 hypothetical protein SEA_STORMAGEDDON_193 [Gordonia phage Stormageddon]QLF83695.1 hypothetical protein SEA_REDWATTLEHOG_192 [Gordonia phage RedWattleHog]
MSFNYTKPQLTKGDPETYWHCWWFLGCPECGTKKYRTQEMRSSALTQFHHRHGATKQWTVELPAPLSGFKPPT